MDESLATEVVIGPNRFREVLGNYPTGVVAVTAIGKDGKPLAMTAGSFTSVSLDPPLVAFLPGKQSSTFPAMREAAGFCINVLSAGQESICRAFARRGGDKYSGISWQPAPRTGSPLLDGVVAWIDCTPKAIHEAGDHYIVVGRVQDLGQGEAEMPLLFFQGGYGQFSSLSLTAAADHGLISELRHVELARPAMQRLAAESGMECVIQARQGEWAFVLAAFAGSPQGEMPRIGRRFPLVPPVGAVFYAWQSAEAINVWLATSEATEQTRSDMTRILADIRNDGYAVAIWSPEYLELEDSFLSLSLDNPTPAQERRLRTAASRVVASNYSHQPKTADELLTVRSISAPIFAPSGEVSLLIVLYGKREMRASEMKRLAGTLLAEAADITQAIASNDRL
jgi:flavin reductase (DIM6/NTAB) family NADH-FMN oxidoreductase RutF/DNA-binding IclR family transcriptional regulator